jgi:hypothetical protein
VGRDDGNGPWVSFPKFGKSGGRFNDVIRGPTGRYKELRNLILGEYFGRRGE